MLVLLRARMIHKCTFRTLQSVLQCLHFQYVCITWNLLCDRYKYWTTDCGDSTYLRWNLTMVICESLSTLIESSTLEVTDYFRDDKDETKWTKVIKLISLLILQSFFDIWWKYPLWRWHIKSSPADQHSWGNNKRKLPMTFPQLTWNTTLQS